MNKYLFIDVETTGVDPQKHGITQISGCVQIDETLHEQFDFFVRPFAQDEIDPGALAVTGMDKRQFLPVDDPGHLQVQGQTFIDAFDAYNQLALIMANHVDKYDKTDKFHFVGYNSYSFDMPFMRRFWEKNNDRYFGSWFWYPGLDVMLLWAQLLADQRPSLPNFKLATVAAHAGINVDKERLHDSQYDIELTRQLWQTAKDRLDRGKKMPAPGEQGLLFDL